MSHFTVLVIGKDAKKQLAPYDENLEVDFNDTEDEDRKEYETETVDAVLLPNGKLVTKYNKEVEHLWQRAGLGISSNDKFVPTDGYTLMTDVPLSKIYKTFEIFQKEWKSAKKDRKMGRYGHWHNAKAKWDWYELGGRWTGYFKLKKGKKGSTGRAGLMTEEAKDGYVDSAKVEDIDFAGMIQEAGAEAKARFEKVEQLLGGSIPVLKHKWSEMIEDKGPYSKLDIGEKRELYHNQAAKKLVTEAAQQYGLDKDDRSLLIWLDLESYQCSKEEYVARAERSALSTFAVLKDGQWYEKGEMGWFGMAHNEMDQDKWNEEFLKLIQGLPEGTLVSVYDCHI